MNVILWTMNSKPVPNVNKNVKNKAIMPKNHDKDMMWKQRRIIPIVVHEKNMKLTKLCATLIFFLLLKLWCVSGTKNKPAIPIPIKREMLLFGNKPMSVSVKKKKNPQIMLARMTPKRKIFLLAKLLPKKLRVFSVNLNRLFLSMQIQTTEGTIKMLAAHNIIISRELMFKSFHLLVLIKSPKS